MKHYLLLIITALIGAALAWSFFHYGGQYSLMALIGYALVVGPFVRKYRRHG